MVDKDEILTNVKELKGIRDQEQDVLLNIIINESEARILGYINKNRDEHLDDLPAALSYILQDVTVMRFNRLNSEGAEADSEEGRSFQWQDSYLSEHKDVLNSYHDDDDFTTRRANLFWA